MKFESKEVLMPRKGKKPQKLMYYYVDGKYCSRESYMRRMKEYINSRVSFFSVLAEGNSITIN